MVTIETGIAGVAVIVTAETGRVAGVIVLGSYGDDMAQRTC